MLVIVKDGSRYLLMKNEWILKTFIANPNFFLKPIFIKQVSFKCSGFSSSDVVIPKKNKFKLRQTIR